MHANGVKSAGQWKTTQLTKFVHGGLDQISCQCPLILLDGLQRTPDHQLISQRAIIFHCLIHVTTPIELHLWFCLLILCLELEKPVVCIIEFGIVWLHNP